MKRTGWTRYCARFLLPVFFLYLFSFTFTDSENAEYSGVSSKLRAVQAGKSKLPSRSFEGEENETSPFWLEDTVESETAKTESLPVRSEFKTESADLILAIGSDFRLSHFLINLPPPIS
ncbi:hypothetical protein [Leptospira kmetyi]|uniref:hypothetical protein n=1 Tax=Leptospira kmetyi TaxID=408139 RepID=UPI000F6373C5|nr:hypothetical protein [Leptospira kmetyi]TGK18243.1 hypothetical protein EHO62_07285 [Leptospira kmetyi]TGK26625.1 hypothetical protein EHO66_17855 [Leptospira kmetyi]